MVRLLALALAGLTRTAQGQALGIPQGETGVFTSGSIGRGYAYVSEGFVVELAKDRPLAVVIKGTGFHSWIKENTNDPAEPGQKRPVRTHFARAQAGLRFESRSQVRLELMGGKDGFDSRAHTAEATLSWWPLLASYHPVQLAAGTSFNDQSRIITGFGSFALGLVRWRKTLWFLTGQGELYSGGSVQKALGRMSGGVRVSVSGWGAQASGGGGADGPSSQVYFYHGFGF